MNPDWCDSAQEKLPEVRYLNGILMDVTWSFPVKQKGDIPGKGKHMNVKAGSHKSAYFL